MTPLNTFDRIAPFYDRIARLVFGSSISEVQRVHLHELSNASDILILGGGTGWLLKDVLAVNAVAQVVYLEASSRMIDLSRQRLNDADRRRVTFLHGTIDDLHGDNAFDAIIGHFYLDLFPTEELLRVARRIRRTLRPNGKFLCADFVDDTRWQQLMLKVMYAFFRITADIDSRQLAPWRELIPQAGFVPLREKRYWKGFMSSVVYEPAR